MKFYLVGGAVRDKLLGLKVKDRDYVVIGSSPQALLSLNYKQVGKISPFFYTLKRVMNMPLLVLSENKDLATRVLNVMQVKMFHWKMI